MVRKEAPMGFLSEDGKNLRPADLLLFNLLQGKDACLDVTCISPFAGMGATSCALGIALHNVVEKKKRKYGSVCEENGYKFIPFYFSTFGEFDTDALDRLSRIKSIFISHSNNAKSGTSIAHIERGKAQDDNILKEGLVTKEMLPDLLGRVLPACFTYVMNLLAEVYSQEDIISRMFSAQEGNQGLDLNEIVSTDDIACTERLLEAEYRRSISVSSSSFWPSFILVDTLRIVFQNLLLESNQEILRCSERVWRLLLECPVNDLEAAARSYMAS
ncbi:hypothetical protein Tco_0289960 [Tanacetum coccineum]